MTIRTADILDAKILIVDDLDVNVKLLGRIPAEAGHVSITTTNKQL